MMLPKRAPLSLQVYLSGLTRHEQPLTLRVCARLRICLTSQNDLIQEVCAQILASRRDLTCQQRVPESQGTCDRKIITGVETQSEIIKDPPIVPVAMGPEVMSIQVVIGSSLTAVILIGARSAAIRPEII